LAAWEERGDGADKGALYMAKDDIRNYPLSEEHASLNFEDKTLRGWEIRLVRQKRAHDAVDSSSGLETSTERAAMGCMAHHLMQEDPAESDG
jgi:hypothetical protein